MSKVLQFPSVDVVESGQRNDLRFDLGDFGYFFCDSMEYEEMRNVLAQMMIKMHLAAREEKDAGACRELVTLRNAIAVALHYMDVAGNESYGEESDQG